MLEEVFDTSSIAYADALWVSCRRLNSNVRDKEEDIRCKSLKKKNHHNDRKKTRKDFALHQSSSPMPSLNNSKSTSLPHSLHSISLASRPPPRWTLRPRNVQPSPPSTLADPTLRILYSRSRRSLFVCGRPSDCLYLRG